MPKRITISRRRLLTAGGAIATPLRAQRVSRTVIVISPQASAYEVLAGREIQRYVYLRTGALLPIQKTASPPAGDVILISTSGEGLLPEQFRLKTVGRELRVIGGDGLGALYGAYRLAELLGIRFYLHGDVVPDRQTGWKLPSLDETGRPLFPVRGVNPWGSHPFGFDQWGADDYKAIFGQLAKMRMNFLGIHCYPEGLPYAEPTVWTGLPGDFDRQGNVTFSFPANYYNTLWKGHWGPIPPKKTGEYSFGGALLFERDDWGPDVMLGHNPTPATVEGANEVFNRTGRQFRSAFAFARRLGVKTCVGTETPLILPKSLKARLADRGKSPSDPAVIRELYEGIFGRIMAIHPLDYYWLWTPEGWTWRGNTKEQLEATIEDIRLALEAATKLKAPFRIATSGWVLGPQNNRAALDEYLPKTVAVSALSRSIGNEPLDPGFAKVRGRDKWAIPWLEGDGQNGLAAVQLWVGRTRRDAAEALKGGCTGLLGLHWRTDALAPQASALAQACWDQQWDRADSREAAAVEPEGAVGGGLVLASPPRTIASAADPVPYLTSRYGMDGYRYRAPVGAACRVILSFCETRYDNAGERVFDVKIQGKIVVENLDIVSRVGKFAALDLRFDGVTAPDGWIRIDFVNRVSAACISGIQINTDGFSRKINCGGPDHIDWAADQSGRGWDRAAPTSDFFKDFAAAWFGPEAAPAIARLFEKIDGKVPQSVQGGCPSGMLSPDPTPWEQVAPRFAFVDEFAALQPRVQGAGNLDRLDYWLNTFRYHRSLAAVRCAYARFERVMGEVEAESEPAKRKALAAASGVPAYRELLGFFGETYNLLLATVNTPGAMAMVVNLENHQHFWPRVIGATGARLEAALGTPLPGACAAPKQFTGKPRLIVPTLRGSVESGEELRVRMIVLAAGSPREVALFWRPLGRGEFRRLAASHVGRGVHEARLTVQGSDGAGVEWYAKAVTANGESIVYPATAPELNQTVVVV